MITPIIYRYYNIIIRGEQSNLAFLSTLFVLISTSIIYSLLLVYFIAYKQNVNCNILYIHTTKSFKNSN